MTTSTPHHALSLTDAIRYARSWVRDGDDYRVCELLSLTNLPRGVRFSSQQFSENELTDLHPFLPYVFDELCEHSDGNPVYGTTLRVALDFWAGQYLVLPLANQDNPFRPGTVYIKSINGLHASKTGEPGLVLTYSAYLVETLSTGEPYSTNIEYLADYFDPSILESVYPGIIERFKLGSALDLASRELVSYATNSTVPTGDKHLNTENDASFLPGNVC